MRLGPWNTGPRSLSTRRLLAALVRTTLRLREIACETQPFYPSPVSQTFVFSIFPFLSQHLIL